MRRRVFKRLALIAADSDDVLALHDDRPDRHLALLEGEPRLIQCLAHPVIMRGQQVVIGSEVDHKQGL